MRNATSSGQPTSIPCRDWIVCTKVGEAKVEGNHGWVTMHNEWRTADGIKVLDEVRTIHLYNFGEAWLLVLDTVPGENGHRVYKRAGWTETGIIPDYALFPDGRLCDTAVMWKRLER